MFAGIKPVPFPVELPVSSQDRLCIKFECET